MDEANGRPEPLPPAPGEVSPESLAAAAADFASPDAGLAAGRDDPDPLLRDSALAQTFFDRAVAEAAGGDEQDAVVHFLRASKLAEAAREWYLAAVACHRVGDIYRTPEPPYDLERAFRWYRRAIAAYEQCGHFEEARLLAYHVMRVKLWHARELRLPLALRAELFVFWAVAGFGYRPQRVVAAAAVVVVTFGILYWATGGVIEPASGQPVGFWASVYFSGITFSTVGYGDLLPAPHVRLLALTEGMIGAFAMSFFVVVLANRLRH